MAPLPPRRRLNIQLQDGFWGDTFLQMVLTFTCQILSFQPLPLCIPGTLLVGSLPQASQKNSMGRRDQAQKVRPEDTALRFLQSTTCQVTLIVSSADKTPRPLRTLMLRASDWLCHWECPPDSWGAPLTGVMETKLIKKRNFEEKKIIKEEKKLIKSLIVINIPEDVRRFTAS